MIREINSLNRVVKIYRTWDSDQGSSTCSADSNDMYMINLDRVYMDGTTELKRLLDYSCEDLSERSTFNKLLNIGYAKPRFLKLATLARLCGTNEKDINAMASGKLAIPQQVNEKLRVYLYHFLTPGCGLDCDIKFNSMRMIVSDEHKRYLSQQVEWQNRPLGITLAHELIHAWRIASGKVLFKYGWEEEAMTVGLPPFSNMRFTENTIRIGWVKVLAIRSEYENIKVESEIMTEINKLNRN